MNAIGFGMRKHITLKNNGFACTKGLDWSATEIRPAPFVEYRILQMSTLIPSTTPFFVLRSLWNNEPLNGLIIYIVT